MNGSGVNEPVFPVLFDTFVSLEVILITPDMMEFFDTACPDYVAPHVNSNVEFPGENRVHLVGEEGARTIRIAAIDNTLVFPRDPRRYVARKEAGSIQVPAVSDTNALPREPRQQTMRRRA